ncbi:MAG: GNAT family N-acetyltransferase, partial [Treponema sp.]|nr:GNAT family N-acetyltransferase [Treponema sp.]
HKHLGKGELLLLLDEDCIAESFPVLKAFVTLCDKDEIVAPELFPWVGFVFTFPKYRGNRLSEKLIDYAAELAKNLYSESENLYVSTDHVGLYEKYGFFFLKEADTVWGEKSRILFRPLR